MRYGDDVYSQPASRSLTVVHEYVVRTDSFRRFGPFDGDKIYRCYKCDRQIKGDLVRYITVYYDTGFTKCWCSRCVSYVMGW